MVLASALASGPMALAPVALASKVQALALRAALTIFCQFLVESQALAVRLDLCFRSVYCLFLSGNIFRTAEPITTKVCTVTANS